MNHPLRVGFIGLGDQGAPMAQAVGASGFELHTWARRSASYDQLSDIPFVAHTGPEDLVSNVDLLLLCLRDDEDVWQVLGQLMRGNALRAGLIVVNHGTGDPSENQRIADILNEREIEFLDAPVSGGRAGAVARTLTTFVGGTEDAFQRAKPVLDTFSRRVARMGASGSGQLCKLLNNALTITNLKNVVDIFGMARRLDIDVAQLRDLVLGSSGASAVLDALGGQINSETAPHLRQLMRKDMGHFADAVRHRGLDAAPVYARAISGTDSLQELAGWLDARRAPST